jgi:hypothetical protein
MKENYTKESWQRVLDAQRRGNETSRKNFEKVKAEYYKNPKKCKSCEAVLPYEKKRNDFCSKSCGAIFNNSGKTRKIKREKIQFFCVNCGKQISEKKYGKRTYCTLRCSGEYAHKRAIDEKKESFENGEMRDECARRFFRKTTNDKICSICGCSEWMGKPIPLVVDHIDGNHNNNFPENFRFVCCNCDAQLDTYKGKNKGKGRTWRK